MNNELLYWVDAFVPAAYTEPAKNNKLYLVVIPCIKTDPAPNPGLIEYLQSFDNAGSVFTFKPLANEVDRSTELLDIVPVPFHPSVNISLDKKRINEKNGTTGYVFKDEQERLGYAVNNSSALPLYLVPQVTGYPEDDYLYLDARQRKRYADWLVSFLTEIKKKEKEINDGIRKKILSENGGWYLVDGAIDELTIRSQAEKAAEPGHLWVKFLALLKKYPAETAKDKDVLSFAFQFSLNGLKELLKKPGAIIQRIGSENNYNKIIAKGLLDVFQKAGGDTKEQLKKTIEQVQLFYGGGERLRIKSFDSGFHHMQVFDDFSPSGTDADIWTPTNPPLVLTNNYSLLGHVLSFPVADITAKGVDDFIKDLDITLNGVQIFDSSFHGVELRKMIKAAYLNLTKNKPDCFLRNILINPDVPGGTELKGKGKVYYIPSNGFGIRDKALNGAYQSFGASDFFSLPELLLDEMEDNPRVEYNDPDSKHFISFPAQRKFFKKEDIRDDGIKDKDGNFIYPAVYNKDNEPIHGFFPGVTVKVIIKKVRLADGNIVYKLSKKQENFCGEDDKKRFVTLLERTVYTNATLHECFIGYNKKEQNGKSQYMLVKPGDAIKDIMSDDDELLELYFNANLANEIQDLDNSAVIIEVDLILLAKQKTNPEFWNCFNILFARTAQNQKNELIEVPPPFIALKERFRYKFNISVNGFSTNLKTQLKISTGFVPSGEIAAKEQEPVISDYVNFNKLRVFLEKGSQRIRINESDALLPESESVTNPFPGPWSGWYALTHRFSENTPGVSTRNANEELEEQRYQLYGKAGTAYALCGWLEHQYAYRLFSVSDKPVVTGYSGPIRHLAQLLLVKEDKQRTGDKKLEVPALYFKVEKGDKKIQLFLNKEYLAMLGKPEESIQYYRELYEALFDIKINADRISVFIEEWDFDNRINSLEPGQAAHPETAKKFPAILHHLARNGNARFSPVLRNIDHFLPGSFTEFKNIKIPQDEIVIAVIDLPKELTGDIVRVGMEIKREELSTVLEQFRQPDGSIKVNDKDIQPTPASPESDPENLSPDSYAAPLQAKAGLENFLDIKARSNELYKSFSYIYAHAYLENFPDINTRSDDKRNNIEEIMGETSRYIAFPGTTVTNTDALTYYVPYSFVPLKIADWEGSQLATATEQYEFIRYLIRILAGLSYPDQGADLKNIIDIKWNENDKLQAFRVRSRVRDEFLRGIKENAISSIAAKLTGLLTHVDNESGAKPGTDHARVVETRNAVFDSLKESFRSLFTANPLKYITAKAMGVGLLPPPVGVTGRFDDLYSFKIEKQISKDEGTGQPAKKDTSHFNFLSLLRHKDEKSAYYVEELEDELYDNEFEIAEEKNRGIEGRTAENVLENNCQYGQPGDKKPQLQVKHYCESWVERSQGTEPDKFYLLPSRKPPVVPLSVTLTEDKKMITKKDLPANEWEELKKSLVASYNLSTVGNDPILFEPIDKTNPILLPDNPEKSEAWNRLDTYVNQYYFLLDPDEESEIVNDLFEIVVESPGTGGINSPADRTELPSTAILQELQKHFIYQVRNAKKMNPGEEIPAPIEVEKLVVSSDPYDKPQGLHQALLDLLVPAENDIISENSNPGNIFNLKFSKGKWELNRPAANTGRKTGPGDVVAVNLLGYQLKHGDGKVTAKKFLLKIAALAEPWTHHRCRVRVRRNKRDFNGDNVFDLNPVFEMASAYSLWTDHGIQLLSYDYLSNENISQNVLKYLPAGITIEKFKSSRKLGSVISGLLKTPNLFSSEIFSRRFSQLVSNRPGYTFMPVFHNSKTAAEIKSWGQSYADKFDKVFVEYTTDQKNEPSPDAVHRLDEVVNPVHDSITGLAPFIQITWYSDEEPNQPVFSINWQLKFSDFGGN